MNHQKENQQRRQRRAWRVRKKVRHIEGRPRLSVYRSLKHIYAQIIDDFAGTTLASASTAESDVSGGKYGGNKDAATAVGKALAARAIEKGVTEVAFDRREYKYHGRVAALADAAREAGLKF